LLELTEFDLLVRKGAPQREDGVASALIPGPVDRSLLSRLFDPLYEGDLEEFADSVNVLVL
jgi:hypothetical protein